MGSSSRTFNKELFGGYWEEYSIPDTKIGRKLYKNQLVRIDDTGIVLSRWVEGSFNSMFKEVYGDKMQSLIPDNVLLNKVKKK